MSIGTEEDKKQCPEYIFGWRDPRKMSAKEKIEDWENRTGRLVPIKLREELLNG